MKDFDDTILFETIFHQSPISTQVFSLNGKTVLVNAAWEKLWKIKFEDISNYNILKDKQLVETGIMKFIKRGFKGETIKLPENKYSPSKSVNITGAVSYRWLQAIMYPIKDPKGKLRYIVLQQEDITDRKAFEQSLWESQRRFKATWESAADAMALSDSEGIVIEANPAYFKLYEFKREEIIGKSFAVIFPPAIRKTAVAEYKQYFHEFKKPGVTEAYIETKTGKKRIVEAKYSFIEQKGKRIALLSVVRDITKQKQMEQDKNDFISIATHELKTPVTSLKAYAETLQRKFARNNDLLSAEQLGKMNGQLDKLTSLISDLLDTTKIEAGKLQMTMEEFRIDELVKEIVEELQRTTDKHRILVSRRTKKVIIADRERLGQVLTNLISNAIKYSPHSEEIIIESTASAKHVTVCIKDFGVGIPKTKQEKLFERFYRVNGPNENTFPGLGLGLYISSEIIKRHDGKIWVESTVGKGSTFCFQLPVTAFLQKPKTS